MAKRKRGGAQAQNQQRRASFDENQKVKLNINSYEDVAGSDDEFHLNREKILLDDGPDAKRRRRLEEQGMFRFLDGVYETWLISAQPI
jgi:U3 small nucleolar RNA-associated protein 3